MRTATAMPFALAAALALGAPPAFAQKDAQKGAQNTEAPKDQKPAATPAATPTEPGGDKAGSETSKEPDIAPSVYTYEVGGRRDPFRSLLIRNPNESHGPRPPGLAGLLVEELELQGTIKVKSGWVAMMRGSDNRAYLLKKGSTVFDGEVIDITPGDVTFRQNVNDPTNPKPFRDVVKSMSLQRKP